MPRKKAITKICAVRSTKLVRNSHFLIAEFVVDVDIGVRVGRLHGNLLRGHESRSKRGPVFLVMVIVVVVGAAVVMVMV